jgi:flagellar motor switch protein FliN/FliY
MSETVRPAQLEALSQAGEGTRPVADGGLDLVEDVKVRLTVSVGGAQVTIRELYAMKEGSVLALDKATGEAIDLLLDGKPVARGELMVAGDHFAVRITEIGKA